MAISVKELKDWLAEWCDDGEMIGIDDGGLTLQTINEPIASIEIGGIPLKGDD